MKLLFCEQRYKAYDDLEGKARSNSNSELTPDLSLDRSVMRTNKLLFDLIQSVLGLGSFLRSEES